MFDKEAIEVLQDGASILQASNAISHAFEERAVVALPEKFDTRDLEQYLPNRRRARGTMATSAAEDFAEYVKAHKEEGACVFVSQDAMKSVAVLNLGTPDKPGHADNKAALVLEKTSAYTSLLTHASGRAMTQSGVAEFIEDWTAQIQCFNDDGPIVIAHAVAAVRKMSIEAMRKVESAEQSLSASKSSFEQVSATSKDPLPTFIHFTCEPYHGLESRTFVMRLSVITSNDKPSISLRIIKLEEHQEAMAKELAELTRKALRENQYSAASLIVPVLLGEYSKN
jgi:uncharacterized protein YfdQ (DUF2303 family)